MSTPDHSPDRVPVSVEVARIIVAGAPRAMQLSAAQGTLPLSAPDLLTALAFLCTSGDADVKSAALQTLRTLTPTVLTEALAEPALHPRLLDLLARARPADSALMEQVVAHPAVGPATLQALARRAGAPVLACLVRQQARLDDATRTALLANPQLTPELKSQLAVQETPSTAVAQEPAAAAEVEETEVFPAAVDGDPAEVHDVSEEQVNVLLQDAAARGLTRYQLAMELKVAEKIKLAVTGDKEWRKILIKDPNKLVHGAVLKNQRISEGEVLAVARNRSSSDEIVRLILLNRDWLKHYEIRKALVSHPKTPLPKALHFIGELTLRDLKDLARNRNVSSTIVMAASRELARKMRRG